MAEFSRIAWTDGTFNPWIGCSRVSPGCQNCYAENLMDHRYGRVKWGPGQSRSRTKTWKDPLKWNRDAEREGIPKRVFCASLADWLDEEVPAQWREDLFDLIEATPWIDWLMLTKRIGNYKAMVPPSWLDNPLPHVWVGTTTENQEWFDKRVPILETIPAAIRWLSYEPALGPIDIRGLCDCLIESQEGSGNHAPNCAATKPRRVNWIIIGGESDQTEPARPFRVEWAEDMIRQCRHYGITPFVKQLGSRVIADNEKVILKSKDGSDPNEWGERLRIREFPVSRQRPILQKV